MKVLSGVHPHGTYEGEIHFEGRELHFDSIRDSEEQGIIIIHQELALVPLMSIAENIFLGNEEAKGGVIDAMKTHSRTVELLKEGRFERIAGRAHHQSWRRQATAD